MKKALTFFRAIFISAIIGLNSFIVTSCFQSSTIVYGNYESYMSPDIAKKVAKDHGVTFDVYGTDDNVASDFKNNIYDIGTVSAAVLVEMQKKGLLKKIDWNKLKELKKRKSEDEVKNEEDPCNWFTDAIKKISNSYEIDILEYGVPYFVQSFVFAYWSKESLPDEIQTWEEILNWIKNNSSGFFEGRQRLICVEDPRSLFSVSDLIYHSSDRSDNNATDKEKNGCVQDVLRKYNSVFSSFTKLLSRKALNWSRNVALMNSDGTIVANELASHGAAGGFMFNGDALLAAHGGEYYESDSPLPGVNFYVIHPNPTPITLDMIVINENSSKEKMERIYKTIFDIAIDKENAFDNFDEVQYTSPLVSVNEMIQEKNDDGNNYWDDLVDDNPSFKKVKEEEKDKIELIINQLKKIYEIPADIICVEEPFSDVQKVALGLSFANFKNQL